MSLERKTNTLIRASIAAVTEMARAVPTREDRYRIEEWRRETIQSATAALVVSRAAAAAAEALILGLTPPVPPLIRVDPPPRFKPDGRGRGELQDA